MSAEIRTFALMADARYVGRSGAGLLAFVSMTNVDAGAPSQWLKYGKKNANV